MSLWKCPQCNVLLPPQAQTVHACAVRMLTPSQPFEVLVERDVPAMTTITEQISFKGQFQLRRFRSVLVPREMYIISLFAGNQLLLPVMDPLRAYELMDRNFICEGFSHERAMVLQIQNVGDVAQRIVFAVVGECEATFLALPRVEK